MRYGGLIAAVVVAALAAIIVLRMSNDKASAPQPGSSPAAEQIRTRPIYVAAKPITVGTAITADMIVSQPWPEQLLLPGFVEADGKTNIVGLISRSSFQQNEPMMGAKLANPNDPNFLAGDLPKGMRVVTIPINETDGVAGFVFPGDHVDLVYTHDVDKWETAPVMNTETGGPTGASAPVKTKATVSETLLTNVKVLAIDQRASGAGATDKDGNLVIPRSASLMVSQADSQRVRLAQHTGTVSLVLRALVDKESADPLVLTGGKDVSQSPESAGMDPSTQADGGVKIIRGAPVVGKETASGSAINRGAPGATGIGNPVGVSAGTGNSIVNPGLVATP